MTGREMLDQRWLWPGALVLLLLLLLSLNEGLNLRLFHAGNALSLYTGDWIWSNITLMGDTLVVLALLLPFVARRPELIWSVLISACIVTAVVHLSKYFIVSPRPAAVLPLESFQIIGYVARSSSFPSGHTAAAFTLAACIALLPGKRGLKAAAVSIAVLAGLSRVVVGIHWPLDVFAGALTGWVGAGLGCYIAARIPQGVGLMGQRIQAGLLVMLALLTVWTHDGGYPQGRLLIVVLPLFMLLLAAPGLKRLFITGGVSRDF